MTELDKIIQENSKLQIENAVLQAENLLLEELVKTYGQGLEMIIKHQYGPLHTDACQHRSIAHKCLLGTEIELKT